MPSLQLLRSKFFKSSLIPMATVSTNSIQPLTKLSRLYFQNVSRTKPLFFTSISAILLRAAVISCLNCCHNHLTGFLLLHLFFLQSFLKTANRGVLKDTSQVTSALCSKPSHGAAHLRESQVITVALHSLPPHQLDLVSSLSVTIPTEQYWPPCSLNKPGTLPPQGPCSSLCLCLESSSHTQVAHPLTSESLLQCHNPRKVILFTIFKIATSCPPRPPHSLSPSLHYFSPLHLLLFNAQFHLLIYLVCFLSPRKAEIFIAL